VEITNKGEYDVTEIVQLYIQDRVANVAPPIKELKGFKRVDIKAGETVKVEFAIKEDMLRYWNADMKYESDPGSFMVAIRPSSNYTVSDHSVKIVLEK
jgi:beta-glucosidase